ncbi:MAG: 16S rRNA (uracil(1498)-N(3))-methyltransferase [Muribaculaceae bacterium]|nr:16S rRNA (uracil(1498)-N(3))-methyltransferase [Muribaculaceae bacterium]
MIRFFAPDIVKDSALPEGESAHCCRVLRLKKGAEIEVVDGNGSVYSCVIVEPNPRHTCVEIVDVHVQPLHWKPYITLAIAPTKNIDRMEWLAEKAVEIGVNRLVFLNCHNNVRRVVKRERFDKILVSAMKQSLKASIPEFTEMIDFKDFISTDTSTKKFVGYCDSSVEKIDFAKAYDGESDITIMVGPEGDFTREEIEAAFNSGFKPVTFGNTRLRTETAGLDALCATHTLISLKANDS